MLYVVTLFYLKSLLKVNGENWVRLCLIVRGGMRGRKRNKVGQDQVSRLPQAPCSIFQLATNFGKAGSRLEIHRRGDYLSFVTLVESKPNHKFDEWNPSHSTPSQISSHYWSLTSKHVLPNALKNDYKHKQP